ncbi:MAG: DUF2182 domain-containing protein [Burkholderiaceae bacterium]
MSLEGLLLHDRWVAGAALAMLCALAWLYLLSGAGMGADTLISSAFLRNQPVAHAMEAMMGPTGVRMWLLTVTMWWVMMIAMMTPSAAPTILLYAKVYRHAEITARASALSPVGAFAAGYLLAWLLFSIVASAVSIFLETHGLASTMSGIGGRRVSAAIVIVAGFYQFSPFKTSCLAHCRSPAAFLSRHWRPGALGALRLGVLHGTYCVGCCWALMALLFVGGVMDLLWIVGLTALVLIEKLVPNGPLIGRGIGVLLVLEGVAIVVA